MNSIRRFLFLLLVLAVPAQAQEWDATINTARSMLETALEEDQWPGVSIAVAVDGDIVWAEGLGWADIEEEEPITTTSLFRVGSVSKPYTAAAVARLMMAGALDPDAPIQTYVPTFPEKQWTISTRQVGGHVAGIRHYRGNENSSDVYYPTVLDGLEIFQDSDLLFEPETQYSYSSYGWNLVSAVVEGASGEPFLDYMQEHVFDPFGMTHSMADMATEDIEGRVSFYVSAVFTGAPVPAPYVDNSYKWAGGGFLSTPTDMIRFAWAHMDDTYLDEATTDFLFTPMTLSDGSSTGYGFGWRTDEDDQNRVTLGHTGGSVGGTTLLTMHPETGTVVAMAINLSRADLNVGRRIMQLFLDNNE